MASKRGRKTSPKGGGRSSASSPSSWGGRLKGALSGFLLGSDVDEETGDRLREIEGLALVGVSLWLILSMASFYAPFGDPGGAGRNWGGQAGWYLANAAFLFFGYAGYVVAILTLCWGLVIVARKAVPLFLLRIFGGLCFVLAVGFLLELGFGASEPDAAGRYQALGSRLPYGPGGWFALQATPFLVTKFGGVGLWVLLGLLAVVSFMLATDKGFYSALTALDAWLAERREKRGQGLLAAVGSWCAALGHGLWDFLRGADLRAEGGAAAVAAPADSTGRTKRAKAAPAKAAAELAPELEEDEELEGLEDEAAEYDEEPELEDDEEYEDEVYDEDDEDEYEYEEDVRGVRGGVRGGGRGGRRVRRRGSRRTSPSEPARRSSPRSPPSLGQEAARRPERRMPLTSSRRRRPRGRGSSRPSICSSRRRGGVRARTGEHLEHRRLKKLENALAQLPRRRRGRRGPGRRRRSRCSS